MKTLLVTLLLTFSLGCASLQTELTTGEGGASVTFTWPEFFSNFFNDDIETE